MIESTQPEGTVTPVTPAEPIVEDSYKKMLSSIPEDIRSNALESKYDSFESFYKGAVNAQAMLGGEKVPVVSKDAKGEDIVSANRKLNGIPDLNEYSLSKPEGIGVEQFEALKKSFHDNGIAQFQANQILLGLDTLRSNSIESEQNQGRKTLDNWQDSFRLKYQDNLHGAEVAVTRAVSKEGIDLKDALGDLINNPAVKTLLVNYGKTLGESEFAGGDFRAGQNLATVQDRINMHTKTMSESVGNAKAFKEAQFELTKALKDKAILVKNSASR